MEDVYSVYMYGVYVFVWCICDVCGVCVCMGLCVYMGGV